MGKDQDCPPTSEPSLVLKVKKTWDAKSSVMKGGSRQDESPINENQQKQERELQDLKQITEDQEQQLQQLKQML